MKTLLVLLALVGCSGITAPVGIHIPGSSETIQSIFNYPEYCSYGWYILMPPYTGAAIELRDGLVWRALPNEYYRLLAASPETGEYWIKIEDKNHSLDSKEYRIKYY